MLNPKRDHYLFLRFLIYSVVSSDHKKPSYHYYYPSALVQHANYVNQRLPQGAQISKDVQYVKKIKLNILINYLRRNKYNGCFQIHGSIKIKSGHLFLTDRVVRYMGRSRCLTKQVGVWNLNFWIFHFLWQLPLPKRTINRDQYLTFFSQRFICQ